MPHLPTLLSILAVLNHVTLVSADAGPHGVGTLPFIVVSHAGLLSARLDPIVSPGEVSSHTHQVVGGSSFGPTYDYDTTQTSKCTSANVAVDFSNYWAPQLYRKADNGSLSLVKLTYANTYYLTRAQDGEEVTPFPKGFKMMAGDASRSTYNASDPAQVAVSYACLGTSSAETPGFPEQSCPDNLRAQVFFPNCWDGTNTWLPGSAHVAYPSTGPPDQGGPCPATHPKRITSLFFEWHYEDDFTYTPGARVLATGDTTGYSFHGDFAMGWQDGVLESVYAAGEACAVEFDLKDCPPLTDHLNSDGGSCVVDKVWVNEDVTGPFSKLPGDNPLFGEGQSKPSTPGYVETTKLLGTPSTGDGDDTGSSASGSVESSTPTSTGSSSRLASTATSSGATSSVASTSSASVASASVTNSSPAAGELVVETTSSSTSQASHTCHRKRSLRSRHH